MSFTARQRSPSAFTSIKKDTNSRFPDGVSALVGEKKDGTREFQSFIFDHEKWSRDQAKAWLREHGFTCAGLEVETGKHFAGMSLDDSSGVDAEKIELRCRIAKVDEYERKIFGWLYVSRAADGTQVVDHSGEIISIKTLEQASYKYVHEHRKMGDMHRKKDNKVIQCGHLIECVVFTPEKRAAMMQSLGLGSDTLDGKLPDGMWVGYQITDAETWADVLSGKKRSLSLGGHAQKVPITQGESQS
jgi:hypothetical protein